MTPQLTNGDMQWLQTAQAIGVPIPSALDGRLQRYRRFSLRATVSNHVWFPGKIGAVGMMPLDALSGIDAVAPESVRTVTPH